MGRSATQGRVTAVKNVASMSFIKVEARKNQERKMGIKKEELRNRNERRSEIRMTDAVRRKRSQTMYKRVRVAHCPDVFRIAEENGSQVLGKQLLRSGALIGGPKFWEIRITGETGIMRILIMIGIIPLSLMASGQTEPQQTTQGQTKESQATTPAKDTKMRPAQGQSMKAIACISLAVRKFCGSKKCRRRNRAP